MNNKNEFGESIEEYDVGQHLGKGGFATVYCARCRNTGRDVAIKKINKSEIAAGGLISRVRQEVTIHSRLNHPSILKLYTFFEDQQFVYLVLELCMKGELQKHLRNLGRVLSENEAREYLSQIVAGMLYLHSHSIMHRDLTLSNILLDNHGRIKIADFGLATQLQHPDDRHTTMCGTPNYISPEVVTRSSHGLESDVWSLGCMLFIMLVGHPPFDSKGVKESIFTKVVMGDYKIPNYVSVTARSLISDCLQKNQKERIKLEAVPHHPFMTEGNKIDVSRLSDSGLYTMSTLTTTHHNRTPLTAILESDVSSTEGIGMQTRKGMKTHTEPFVRHPASPPVRMKSSPRDLLPPNAGVIDNLKRKFTPLPSLKREDFVFPTPPLPPLIKRERDVSEERRRQKHLCDQRFVSSSSCDDHSSFSQYSSSQNSDEAPHDICRESKERTRSRSRNRGSDRSVSRKDSHIGSNISRDKSSDRHRDRSRDEHSGHQIHESSDRSDERYSDLQRSPERIYTSDYIEGDQRNERVIENQVRSVENYCVNDSKYMHSERSRERGNSMHSEHSHQKYRDAFRNRGGQERRSRSLEKYKETSSKNYKKIMEKPEQNNSRDKSRETYRDKTHSCCQSSHHRSWCERRGLGGSEKADALYSSERYSVTEKKGYNSNPEMYSNYYQNASDCENRKNARPSRLGSSVPLQIIGQNNMLNDIPPVVNMSSADSENVKPGNLQALENPPQQHEAPQKLAAVHSQTLRQQVSPLTSRRLKKVRYRSNRYFLNILDNGEVCLEHLCNKQNSEIVDDVCRISPDGLRIVIYQPNGGLGSQPGVVPPPLPDEGADLIFSYENLPVKYWNKYKAAARFVKLLKSKTTKITYYSEKAKFFLMENSPDPDFVATFYHGVKITKSSNTVVIREPTGDSHMVPHSSSQNVLPAALRPLYQHFKQMHDHCLYLERVLTEVTDKTGVGCFPAIMGSKPVSISTSPPESARSKPYTISEKENLSPSSMQSFKSPRNISSQLGSFEGSIASVQVIGNYAPCVKTPLTPHTSSNRQVKTPVIRQQGPRIYVQNIGWASQGSNGEVSVEYLDGTQVQVSSNSPKVVFTEASGTATTYSVSDKLPPTLQNKLAQMETVLSCLAQSPASSKTPLTTQPVGLR
ncbi:serine/threonine-protein kinase PLK4-like [Panulirus ornatus]|uniref:serine/threonine-protein kinase PLK4-like n=1 Tax=Panulirus ornatus TaxID=150431 RepID=UPI003A8B26EF